jgi:hypothetical protein
MASLYESKVLWITGAIVGAVCSPNGKRFWGGLLGGIVVGSVGDVALERIARHPERLALPPGGDK